jgi:hypothetical protein
MSDIDLQGLNFSGVLSDLGIDANKDWGDYAITNIKSLAANDFISSGGTSELQFSDATADIGVNGDDDLIQLGVNSVKLTGTSLGFFNATPVTQRLKANYNNWAALADVVSALVDLNLFDQT